MLEEIRGYFYNNYIARQIFVITIILGLFVSIFTACNSLQDGNIFSPILLEPGTIFMNNIKCGITYIIPFYGWINYILAMIYNFSVIGMSVTLNGLFYTIKKLTHLPLEVWSFSLFLSISIQLIKHKISAEKFKKLFNQLVHASIILALSAVIESRL